MPESGVDAYHVLWGVSANGYGALAGLQPDSLSAGSPRSGGRRTTPVVRLVARVFALGDGVGGT